jgi:ribosomal protein S18 acetylase RimI-like enzyme
VRPGRDRADGETAPRVTTRRVARSDVQFLRDLLRHAYYWRWASPDSVPAARYVEGWGRAGDAGLIALDAGFRVGGAWYRLFAADAPGYGFVDERTPELTIAVVPSRRGRGIGEHLLSALIEQARRASFEALSLSVERGNPAVRLYERFGFSPVREERDTLVMRAPLRSHET